MGSGSVEAVTRPAIENGQTETSQNTRQPRATHQVLKPPCALPGGVDIYSRQQVIRGEWLISCISTTTTREMNFPSDLVCIVQYAWTDPQPQGPAVCVGRLACVVAGARPQTADSVPYQPFSLPSLSGLSSYSGQSVPVQPSLPWRLSDGETGRAPWFVVLDRQMTEG